MGDVNLDYERVKDNDGGEDNAKALIHAKRWDVYTNERENLFKVGYQVEVVGHDGKKFLWEVVDNNVAEQPTDHDEIGLREFDLNFFGEYDMEVGR